MNCSTCGGPYILGHDAHAHCRAAEEAKATEARRLENRIQALELTVEQLIAAIQDLERAAIAPREIQPIDHAYQPVWKN